MGRFFYILCVFTTILIYSIISAQGYKNTTVTPYLKVKHSEKENIIYSSTFSLAWKMLQADIIKDKIKTKQTLKLVTYLNDFNPAQINKSYSVSLAGFVSEGIDKTINKEMKEKFNRQVDLSSYTDDPSNIICYSFFEKKMHFNAKFENFDQTFPFFSGGKSYDVECFGIWTAGNNGLHTQLRKLVKVVDYKNPGDFIVAISNPADADEIIIALIEPMETLDETIKDVAKRIQESKPTGLVDNDRLVIPKIKIDAEKHYSELFNVHLANKGFERYFFAEAIQTIGFQLNESGASADSEAKLILKKGPGPRTMLVNHPFLVMMKDKNSHKPYFAAWVANPELLISR